MDAIILVGGLGTRLKEVVSHVPKPLAPINNRPFLDILLSYIGRFPSIEHVVLATGFQSQHIINFCAQARFPFSIDYSVEEHLLGTGGAIKLALAQTQSQTVAIFNGDSYFALDLNLMIKAHKYWSADLTIACSYVEDTARFGSISLQGAKILAFQEKINAEGPGWINGGVYLLNRDLPLLEQDQFSLEKDFFPQILNKRIFGYCSSGQFIDIGTKDSYAQAQGVLA